MLFEVEFSVLEVAETESAEGLAGPMYSSVSVRVLAGRTYSELATTSRGDRISVTEKLEEIGAVGFTSEASAMASSLIAPRIDSVYYLIDTVDT